MSDPVRQAKDAAIKLLAKGKLDGALVELRKVVDLQPHDIATRQRLAETLAKLGRRAEAVREFQHAVGGYAADGQLLKAVALCKVILQLEPGHTETQRALADLYAKRRGDEVFTAQVPASMAAAMPKTLDRIQPAPAAPSPERELVPTDPELGTAPHDQAPIELSDEAIVESVDVDVEVEVEHSTEVSVEPAALPHIPLLSDLGRSALSAVLDNVDIENFEPGQLIVREGDRDRRMFAIVQGTVSVRRGGPGKAAHEVAQMKEGDFFGEIALVGDSPRLASVAAATRVVLMVFTRERMDAIVQEHPSVGTAVERFYRERLLANVLRSSALFQPLTDEERAKLTAAFRLRTAPRGAVLLEQGAPPDGFYLLLRGTCDVFDKVGGKVHRYPSLGEGAVFGEVSLVMDQPVSATVKATTDVVLLRLARPAFKEHIIANAAVRRMITRLSVERIVRTRQIHAQDAVAPPPALYQV